MSQLRIKENLAISDSGFLFFPTTGETFTVNAMGTEIIKNLKEGKNFGEIIDFLLRKFDVDKETAERDLDDFLSQLKNYDLAKES